MPRKYKGAWRWNPCAIFALAETIRSGGSSTTCASTIMALQRAGYPEMELDNNSIISAMRNKTVPGMLTALCPDSEELLSKFHSHKPGFGQKGRSGGSIPYSKNPKASRRIPGKTVDAETFLGFRQRQ